MSVYPNPMTSEVSTIMRALVPEALMPSGLRSSVEPLVLVPDDRRPLGRHRRRSSDSECFRMMVVRRVTGCSWAVADRLCDVGVELLATQAIGAYDRVVGLDCPKWRSTPRSTRRNRRRRHWKYPSGLGKPRLEVVDRDRPQPFRGVGRRRPTARTARCSHRPSTRSARAASDPTSRRSTSTAATTTALSVFRSLRSGSTPREREGPRASSPATQGRQVSLGLRWPVERTN